MPTEVTIVRGNRDFAIEQRTGLKALTLTLFVAHDLGSFELTLEVDRWSNNPQIVEDILRPALKKFAQELAEADILPTRSTKSPHSPPE